MQLAPCAAFSDPSSPLEKGPFCGPYPLLPCSQFLPKESVSCSLSLDPGLTGRQTLGHEARPPGLNAQLCSLLAGGLQLVTCHFWPNLSPVSLGHLPHGGTGWAWSVTSVRSPPHPRKPPLIVLTNLPPHPRLHWSHFVVRKCLARCPWVPWAQHCPGFTPNACHVDKMGQFGLTKPHLQRPAGPPPNVSVSSSPSLSPWA